ncbi:hypothetical protein DYD21_02030 [Rhodohalobacter sp. SW132]|uniref:hypothetical protein n=1 Tax=Rhodohalobacter sp. SW132 TaxID=2293433 RepID=UPI000E26AC7C|nr:hypothetical protein [Rhodohalobacter sp. SW132]REL38752.1 hypothetical protein DYD21_02030 [Rhodohalobacter sp. SW132]
MLRTAATAFFSLFILFGTASILHGQEAAEQAPQNLLPEIDPQDIEIRSQFQARFPGLRRQPILGFNPSPRVFQIDPNRTPFIESEEAVAASLPVGELDRPDAPGYTPLSYANPQRGFARLGIGSYITPEADIYMIQGLGSGNWVSGNMNHRSSNGHLDDFSSSFREFDTSVRSQFRPTERTQIRLNTGVFSNFNYLPPDEADLDPFSPTSARSSYSGFRLGGNMNYNRTAISGFSSVFNFYTHQFDINSGESAVTGGEAGEWGGNIGLNYAWAGSRVEEVYSISAKHNMGGIEMIGRDQDNWSITQAGVTYERLLNYQTDIEASLGGAYVSDAFDESTFYITPKIDIRHTLLDGIDVRGRFSGQPEHRSLKTYRQMNRFIGLTDPVSHQYNTDVRGEVIMEPLNGTMFTGGVQFKHIRNYAYFTRTEDLVTFPEETAEARFSYQPNFENASFLKVYGSFSQQLAAEKFWVGADAYWQRPRLSGNNQIPFVEALGLKGTASFRPIRDLVVEGWADFKGSRHNPNGYDLSSFLLIGTRFELALTSNAGIYAKLLNINDVNYEIWQGYEERGFQAYVGITYLF